MPRKHTLQSGTPFRYPPQQRRSRPLRPSGGMGDPMQTEYYDTGYRDPGRSQPRPKDVVFDPTQNPNNIPPEQAKRTQQSIELILEALKEKVFPTKRPAFVEPPFFSKPEIMSGGVNVPAGAGFTPILTREVEARQRAIVALIGIETDQTTLYDDRELIFSIRIDGQIAPYFNDQFSGLGISRGETSRVPGTLEQPFCIFGNGVQFEVVGKKTIEFGVRNLSGTTAANVDAMMGLYQYWTPNASEFAGADIQV